MKFKDYILIILSVVIMWLLFRPNDVVIKTDTVVKRDTIYDTIRAVALPPKIVERWRDTIIYIDSSKIISYGNNQTIVEMPLNRYTFEDTGYKIELEGIAVKPIKFEFIQPKITNTVTNATKQKKLNFGTFGGVGLIYGTKGLDVGFVLGVGFQYKF